MNIKPLDDRVLIEPISEEQKTKSGIVIPDTVEKEKPRQGKVIAAGPGRIDSNGNRIPMNVKKGDVILFLYEPTEIKVGNKKYSFVKEDEILAIIK